MQQLMPTEKDNCISSVFSETNHQLVQGKDAANEINEYFCRISTELDAKLPAPSNIQIYISVRNTAQYFLRFGVNKYQ